MEENSFSLRGNRHLGPNLNETISSSNKKNLINAKGADLSQENTGVLSKGIQVSLDNAESEKSKTSVATNTAKTNSMVTSDECIKNEAKDNLEYEEEKGGYEDDDEQEPSDSINEEEESCIEMDEEGGYEDEDEENEEC